MFDVVNAFDVTVGDADDAENDGSVFERFQQCQVIQAVCVFDGQLLHAAAIDGPRQLLIAGRVGFQIVFVIEVTGIGTGSRTHQAAQSPVMAAVQAAAPPTSRA